MRDRRPSARPAARDDADRRLPVWLAVAAVVVATAGIAVLPGPAPAATPGGIATTRQAAADPGATAADPTDDPSADDDTTDDDPSADDDGAADDGTATDDDATADDTPQDPVAVDVRGRLQIAPGAFVATKTARATKLHWSSWGHATTTGRGRLTIRTTGRRAHRASGVGVVRLDRMTTCADGGRVYRRARLTVPGKGGGTVTAALPGCSALGQ